MPAVEVEELAAVAGWCFLGSISLEWAWVWGSLGWSVLVEVHLWGGHSLVKPIPGWIKNVLQIV